MLIFEITTKLLLFLVQNIFSLFYVINQNFGLFLKIYLKNNKNKIKEVGVNVEILEVFESLTIFLLSQKIEESTNLK